MMPRPLLIVLTLLCVIPLIFGIWDPIISRLGQVAALLVVLLGIVDVLLSVSPNRIDVRRDAADVISVGTENTVRLFVTNRSRSPLTITLHDAPPQPCRFHRLPSVVRVAGRGTKTVSYEVEPLRRGRNAFESIDVRLTSRLRLWTLQRSIDASQPIQIYPDVLAVQAMGLLARHNRLAQAGVRMSRLKGRGNEFDRLREYRRGDEYRSIDWKATARHRQPISREYVVERNQNILVVLDCGRAMCNEHEGVSHFDRALNAAILLAHIAFRQGDSFGLLACSNRVERWIPPIRSGAGVHALVQQVYDLPARYEATDYELMADQVRIRHRKRSLVIVLTHALDEVHLTQITEGMQRIRRPHLVLGAFLKNQRLEARLNAVPTGSREAFQIAAAAELATWQSRKLAELEGSGFLVTHCTPEALSGELITEYLEIKARHLL